MTQRETKVEARTIAKATSHEGKAGATEIQKDGTRELVKKYKYCYYVICSVHWRKCSVINDMLSK